MALPLFIPAMFAGSIGGGLGVVALTVTAISDTDGASATASVIVQRDGDLTFGTSDTVTGETAAEWVSPRYSTVGDLYEARITVNSGAGPAVGTAGVWTALSSNETWSLLRVISPGTTTGNWTLEIRLAGSGVVQDSTTFDISATIP